MPRPRVHWPTAHLDDHPATAAADRAPGDVVPRHPGSGPLTLTQYHRARVRIAVEQLAMLVQDLETSPAAIRQAATQALTAVVELQAVMTEQPPCSPMVGTAQ